MDSACAVYISVPNMTRRQSTATQLSNMQMHTVHHCGAVEVSVPLAARLYGEDCMTTESPVAALIRTPDAYIAGYSRTLVCSQLGIARMPTCTPIVMSNASSACMLISSDKQCFARFATYQLTTAISNVIDSIVWKWLRDLSILSRFICCLCM